MWKRTFLEALVIIATAAAVGLLVNHYRADGLELATPGEGFSGVIEAPDEFKKISIESAAAKFHSPNVLFADARTAVDFARGHIRGAVNLPPAQMDTWAEEMIAEVAPDVELITYCDGEQCPLARELAEQLTLLGFETVYVLEDGWHQWQSRDLPVDDAS